MNLEHGPVKTNRVRFRTGTPPKIEALQLSKASTQNSPEHVRIAFVLRFDRHSFLTPLSPKVSPFDEENCLALDRVKPVSHYRGIKG